MAQAKCPECKSHTFANELVSVTGYNYQLNLIKCAYCGYVVGVMPFYDPGILAHKNQQAIEDLKKKVSHIEQMVTHLYNRRG
jgi:uncharacterized Zn finger protein